MTVVTKFQLKLTILFFGPNLPKKGVTRLLVIDNFFFFGQIFPERIVPVENGKIALVCASMVVTYYIKL